jgi:type I restriction enzyme S subunit
MIRGQDYSESKGWASPADIFRVSAGIEERYRNARVRTGDLIMTIVGYCGHVEQVPDWLDDANLTQTTARIAIDAARAVGEFCKYALQSAIGKTQVASYIKGAAQPGLNCGDVEQFLLPIPSRAEQRAIAAVLSDMDGELTALEQRRAKTQLLKQGMMQELLTGRTRLL